MDSYNNMDDIIPLQDSKVNYENLKEGLKTLISCISYL